MNLQYRYGKYHSMETRMDILNHLSCFRMNERRSPSVVEYHRETIQKFIDEGGKPVIHDTYVDEFEMELGLAEFALHVKTFDNLTIWKEYCLIKESILTLRGSKKEVREHGNVLLSVLNSPSTEMDDLQSIYFTLNDLTKKVYDRKNLDYYKELFGTVFMQLLPYKVHAFGMTTDTDSDLAPADEVLRNYSCNYFEILIRMFTDTLQSIRGSSLVDTKEKLKTLTVVCTMFLTAIYPNKEFHMDDLRLFTDYINSMLASGIGTNIGETILKMQRDHTGFFDLVSQLGDQNQFLNYMVNRQKDYYNQTMKTCGSLNKEFSSMFVTGYGRYNEKNYPKEKFEDLCYGVNGIDDDTIKEYVDINGRKINYAIDENQMGYILKKVTTDAGSLRTPRGEIRFFIHPSSRDMDFVLFRFDDSKDVYGLSVQTGADKSRVLLKLGLDSSEYSYKLAMDETM